MSVRHSTRARRFIIAGIALLIVGVGVWQLLQEGAPSARVEPTPVSLVQTAESPVAPPAVAASEVSAPVPTPSMLAQLAPATLSAPAMAAVPAMSAPSANHAVFASLAPNPPESAKPITEVEGTRRMYAAHAPLRVAEVANPDSEANRMILQNMVQKALARASSESRPKN